MSLDPSRITQAALAELSGLGFEPTKVPYLETGKSATELLLTALANAVVAEIAAHGVVSVTLDPALAAWMALGVPVPLDGGAALKTTLIAAATQLQASGTME